MTSPNEAADAGSPVVGRSATRAPVASILVVDDDPATLLALQELLQGMGQNLVLAKSGEEALRHALRNDFAVILMDVRMPGLDGFQTAKLIRGRHRSRHTPIIFITGASDDPGSICRGYEVGAVDYLMKPVMPDVLKSKVSVFVELHRKSERLKESEDKLRRLAAHLISVREEERAHIARVLEAVHAEERVAAVVLRGGAQLRVGPLDRTAVLRQRAGMLAQAVQRVADVHRELERVRMLGLQVAVDREGLQTHLPAFDVGVLDRLTRPDEGELHRLLVGPGIEPLAFELWAMVDGDRTRQAAQIRQPVQHRHHARIARPRPDDVERDALRVSGKAGPLHLEQLRPIDHQA